MARKRAVISKEEAMRRLDAALAEVRAEVEKAINKHGGMASAHEGYAVIQEEVDELWDEVKADRGYQESAMEEAVQVAAMGVKYLIYLRA
jgi:hypothetical protein